MKMVTSSNDRAKMSRPIEQSFLEARSGSMEALGNLLEACRPYLMLVAHEHLRPGVQRKIGPSDLVQETFLKAQQHFERFHGQTEKELLAWLRRILFNNLLNSVRFYSDTDKRQIDREVELVSKDSIDPAPSPASDLIAREEAVAVRQAVERLAEEYRRVVLWRSWERLPFDEIGRRLGRSAEAARKLWARAVDELAKTLESPHACG